MDLICELPAIRRERGGVVILDRLVFYCGWIAAGWAVINMQNHDGHGIILGAMIYLVVLAALPAWIHMRLWPRMAWLAGDAARRDELFMAGLAGPRDLWAALRRPLWRTLFVPVSINTILLAGLFVFVFDDYSGRGGARHELVLVISGVLVALSLAVLGLAGAADVFGRMCRGMARGNAVLVSVAWVFATTVALPFIFFWAANDLLGASEVELLLGGAVAAMVLYLWVRRFGVGRYGTAARRFLTSREPVIASARIAVAAAGGVALVIGPFAWLAYESQRHSGGHHAWDTPVALGFGLGLACVLMLERAAFALRAFQYGRDI